MQQYIKSSILKKTERKWNYSCWNCILFLSLTMYWHFKPTDIDNAHFLLHRDNLFSYLSISMNSYISIPGLKILYITKDILIWLKAILPHHVNPYCIVLQFVKFKCKCALNQLVLGCEELAPSLPKWIDGIFCPRERRITKIGPQVLLKP